VVALNLRAVDQALKSLRSIVLSPEEGEGPAAQERRGSFAALRTWGTTLEEIVAGRGDALPVSAMPCDGTFPTATARFEKRNLAQEIPAWETAACIQCGKCAMVCPHAAIRIKAYDPALLSDAPSTFKSLQPMHKDW